METNVLEEIAERIALVVGAGHLHRGTEAQERHSRDTIPWRSTSSLVVYPGSTEEVQEIVRIARDGGLPVWPYSTGRNWGYGATMATHEGALILILERMNRILEVNEELAFAVVEPGVTQRQLYEHLKESGSRLWIDCTDSTPEASILGNALERGVGYTPYGDHYGQLCGLEAVLPDGELLRTSPGDEDMQTRHTYSRGLGPMVDGLFSQSNFGVVTRAGIWLMPKPESVLGFFLQIRSEEDLPGALDAIRDLSLTGVVNSNIHTVSDFLFSTLLEQFPFERCLGRSRLGDDELAELTRRYGLAPWNLGGALYGTRAQVRAGGRIVRRRLRPFGKVIFLDDFRIDLIRRVLKLPPALLNPFVGEPRRRLFDIVCETFRVFNGVPTELFVSRWEYYKSRRTWPEKDVNPVRDGDGTGLIWFPPLAPLSGETVLRIIRTCRPSFEKHGFNYSAALVMVNSRTLIVLMQIFFDRQNPDEARRAIALYEEISSAVADQGFFPYRSSVATMGRALERNPVRKKFLERCKGAIDPANILAPGRYGLLARPDQNLGAWRPAAGSEETDPSDAGALPEADKGGRDGE